MAAKDHRWAELSLDEATFLDGAVVRDEATRLRDLIGGANVTLEAGAVRLPTGQNLLDLVADLKETLCQEEVKQS